jgi:hypothetical protein
MLSLGAGTTIRKGGADAALVEAALGGGDDHRKAGP